MVPPPRPLGPVETRVTASGSRPIGPSRHRRTESLRALRAHAGEPSGVVPTPQPALASMPAQAPDPISQQPLVPIAFLDLDLIILKANSTFQQLFANVQNLHGRRFTEIARATERDSFQTVRNRLREEREAKDPAYLPPIERPGHDPLPEIREQDIEEVTRGFQDRTHFWTYNCPGEPTLPTRIRLARTSVYFAVVMLPPLPQAGIVPTQALGPPPNVLPSPRMGPPLQIISPFLDAPLTQRPTMAQTAPPSPYYHHPQNIALSGQLPTAGPSAPRTYPPPQVQLQYQQPSHQPPSQQPAPQPQQQYPLYTYSPPIAQAPAPMQPTAEPTGTAMQADPFTPRFRPRGLSQASSVPADFQLPPLTAAVPRPFIASSPQQILGPRQHSSSSEESAPGNVHSSNKRRRMGIDDVLQREPPS